MRKTLLKSKNKPDGINYNIVNCLPILYVGRIMIFYYLSGVLYNLQSILHPLSFMIVTAAL